MPLRVSSTCAHHQEVKIVLYTASGIITPIGGSPVHGTTTCRRDDTRGCIIQFWPPDKEHMVLETRRGMK